LNTAFVSGEVVSTKYTPTKNGSRLGIRVKRKWGDKPAEFWNVAVWNDGAEFLKDRVKEGMNVCAIGYLSQFVKGEDTIVFVNATEVHPLGDWDNMPVENTGGSAPSNDMEDPHGAENDLSSQRASEPEDDDGELDPFDVGW
jgi:single-stranded DNA-binding protein